jgi:ATP-dependent 26S proteasome regulatory subunit
MVETMSWMDLLKKKRRALYSAVVIVDTNDDKRIQDFIKMRDSTMIIDPESKAQKPAPTYVWDTVAGLFRRERGKDLPVGSGGLMENPMDSVQRTLYGEKNATVIIKNVLKADDVPMKNLNLWATHDDIFRNGNTVVVFVPGKDVIDLRVLEKCILVTPPLSTADERYMALDRLVKDLSITLPEPKQNMDQMVAVSGGLDLNQTEAVFVETLQDFGITKSLNMNTVAKTKAEIISKSNLLKVLTDVPNGFESVGGYDAVKGYITNNLIAPLKEPRRAKELGVERPRGAILFGPGGTGKTILSKAIAKELNYPFVILQPEGFMSSYVGETERNLSKAIRVIEDMSPCIVFIDEIDRLGGRKASGENDGGTMQRAFSQLLEWLGDMKRQSIVIGATNMPYLDEAFRREGRFDVMIPMLSPDSKARMEILKVHLNVVRQVKHTISKKKLEEIVTVTDGWKGNMLEELVKRATRAAFLDGAKTVSDKHLQEAYDDYTINRDALTKSEDKYVQMAKDLCNSQRFLKSLLEEIEKEDGRTVALKRASI